MSTPQVSIRRDQRPASRRGASALQRSVLMVMVSSVVAVGQHRAAAMEAPAIPPLSLPPGVVLELARSDIAHGRLDTARTRLELLLQHHPGHEEAQLALAELAAAQQSPTHHRSGSEGEELARELLLAEGRRLLARGEEEARRGDRERAVASFERAEAALGQGGLDPALLAMRRQIALRREQVQRQIIDAHSTNRDPARQAAEATTAGYVVQESERFQERIRRIEALEERGLLQLALGECRALLRDHRDSPDVRALFRRLLDASHAQRELALEERHQEVHQELQEQLSRSLIPTGFNPEPLFPTDWQDRHPPTGSLLEQPQQLARADEILRERLLGRITLQVAEQDAVQVLMALANQAGLNLVIDPAVTTAGRLVTLNATDITLAHALSWICRLIDTQWQQANGGVYIGVAVDEVPVAALYDVSDILFQPQDQVPDWRLGKVANETRPPPPGTQQAPTRKSQ